MRLSCRLRRDVLLLLSPETSELESGGVMMLLTSGVVLTSETGLISDVGLNSGILLDIRVDALLVVHVEVLLNLILLTLVLIANRLSNLSGVSDAMNVTYATCS